MASFVKDMRDFLLLKSHYLYRLENGTIREMIKPYEQAKKEILEKLARVSTELEDETKYTQFVAYKLNYLLAEINEVLRLAAITSERTLEQIRNGVAGVENEQLTKILNDKYNKVGIDILSIPYRQVDYILQNPLMGESIGDKLLWANNAALRYMQRDLYQSIILGESINAAAKRLLGRGEKLGGLSGNLLVNRARTIARSEILYVSNEVNRAIFRQNQDVIKGVQYVSALDSRTCIAKGTKIITEGGNKPIEHIEVGNKVLTHTGNYRKVKNTSSKIAKKYLCIKLSNGQILKITKDHRILTSSGDWVEAQFLNVGDKVKCEEQ